MLSYIQAHIGADKDLGFGPMSLPDEAFLVAVCHALNSNLEMFTGMSLEEELVQIPLSFLQRLNFFDPYARKINAPVIQKSSEQKKREMKTKLSKRINKKIRRKEYLSNMTEKLHSDVDCLHDQMRQEDEV